MKWDEQRQRLLAKAAEDQKALLCHFHVQYQRDHDLVEKLDALADAGVIVPPEIERCKYLQPYAVQFRYDDVPVGHPSALDRTTLQLDVEAVRKWVTQTIADRGSNPRSGKP